MPARVPAGFGTAVAAVSCVPPGAKAPDRVQYWKFGSQRELRAAYAPVIEDIAPGLSLDSGCADDGARGSFLDTGTGPF